MRKKILYICSILVISFSGLQTANAQLGDSGEMLKGGVNDANILLYEYLKPAGKGFGYDLNSGWINTARPYRTLGFDIRLNVAASIVPTGDRSFNVDNLTLENLERVDGPSESQTAFGEDIEGSTMGVFGENPFTGLRQEVTRFTMPKGSGFPIVPAPMIQLTVGAVKDTDVTIRYIPSVSVSDLNVNLFGFGVKHGLNQWLPGGSVLPVDLSVQLGYTKFNSDFGFDVNPEVGNDIYNPYEDQPNLWDGQAAEFEASGFTGNVLVGKNLPIISVFAGLGLQSSEVSLSTPGSYPITSFNPDYNPTSTSEETREKIIERIDDPVGLTYENGTSFQALAGFRIRLTILTISASYTLSEYPTANVGVGLSFR